MRGKNRLKVKTVIDDRFPKRKVKSADRFILAVALVAETGINTMLPFAFGFYFAITGNLIFILLFFLNILFMVKVRRKGRKLEFRITRGI